MTERLSIEVGCRLFAYDVDEAVPPGGTVIEVDHENRKVVVVQAHGQRKSKTEVDVAVIDFADINPETIEYPGRHSNMKVARAMMRRMGERTSGTRTPDDERDFDTIRRLVFPDESLTMET